MKWLLIALLLNTKSVALEFDSYKACATEAKRLSDMAGSAFIYITCTPKRGTDGQGKEVRESRS